MPNDYDLFAVVIHTGTLNGGHYTALAKNKRMGVEQWYEFNDHQVIQLSKNEYEKRIISNHAYILFYQKRGIDFDVIQDYDMIKNELRKIPDETGRLVEVFEPERIRFPRIDEIRIEQISISDDSEEVEE